jgi:mono/diheme cytochrome c family protein
MRLLAIAFVLPALAADRAEFFETRIRPLLAEKCHGCHSASRMGGLDLTSRDALLKGGNSGAAVVPGKPEDSLLLQAVNHRHPKLKMPPGGKLDEAKIRDLAAWIGAGAVWPEGAAKDAVPPPSKYHISEKQRSFWSFRPVRKPALPAVRDAKWAKTPVDHFVLAKLEEKGLRPVAPADRRTLIRRVYFNLTGLPPTLAEVEAFERDKSPDAFAKVVDRLLASPHYGERWGRYWLDVARYSDDRLASQFEIPHPSAFRYRDWVIDAFNRDMPYDVFVKAQFAGDLIPGREKELAAGTGFFALSPEQQDDRVDAATRGFLGLTVACAQCHDHKFDPIPTRDYYSLLGVFLSTKQDEFPLAEKTVVEAYQAHEKRIEEKKKELEALRANQARELAKIFAHDTARYLRAARGESSEGLDPVVAARWCNYVNQAQHEHPFLASLDPEAFQALAVEVAHEKEKLDAENQVRLGLNPQRRDLSNADLLSLPRDKHYLWRDLFGDKRASLYYMRGAEVDRYLSAPFQARVRQLEREIRELEESLPPRYPFLQTIRDVEDPKDIRVWVRGNKDNLGEVAPRRFLQVLSKGEPPPFTKGSGRLELAESIASADNPLTARVFVNRMWQWHFGRGIVATPSNFGQLGERPTHPELLDYLAARFVELGWSVKSLHREILLSSTYALSAAGDPANEKIDADNVYLWRANRRRLDIETMRDAMLAATDELDLSMGGQPRKLNEESNKRRTVYGFVSRRDLDPTLLLFDFANPNATSERRIDTSTPLQRLFLLNSNFVERRAAELACRLESVPAGEARVRKAYEILFQRAPSREEIRLALDFVSEGGDGWKRYAQVLLASNEFVYVN